MLNVKKRMSFTIAVFIFIFAAACRLNAQNKSPQALIQLNDAKNMALENNHDYKIASIKLNESKEKINSVWGQLMPAVESEASALRQSAENGFMSLSDGQYDLKLLQLKFGINPGVFYNSLQVTQQAYKAAQEDVRRIKSDIELSVIKNYFNILLADEIIKMRKESAEVLKSNVRDVENLYKTGAVPKFELLQAQVQLNNSEPALLEAENTYNLLLDTFNYQIGAESLKYAADKSILDNGSYSMPRGDAQVKIEKLSQIALKNRPEIIQLEAKKAVAEHSKAAASSFYLWPTFTVGGYYGYTKYLPNPVSLGLTLPGGMQPDLSQISGTDEWQNTWQVRIAATYKWDALIPANTTNAVKREEALKIREAEQEISKLKRLIGISIRSSYSRLLTSYLTIKSQKENVATAEEGLRIARESYRAGVIKNSELLSAELACTNAKTSYINAVNSYYISLAELKKEMGIDDERIILEDKHE